MKQITSVNNSYIKELMNLKKNKYKQEKNLFLVDGIDFIDESYRAGCLTLILTNKEIEDYFDIEKILVSDEIIKKLSSNVTPTGIIGVCKYPTFNEHMGEHLIYLDGVQDPGNVGTIIRTALAFNYDGVILSEDSASIFNDKVIASSKGAIFKMPIYFENLEELKKMNYQLIASGLKDSVDYRSINLKDKFVIIVGNEGQGVKKSNLLLSDVVVKIPMDNIDSLNVGIASGILLNEYRK